MKFTGFRIFTEHIAVFSGSNGKTDIPRDALVVFTGVSGSGKSSLAFGTLYARAARARRYDAGRFSFNVAMTRRHSRSCIAARTSPRCWA